jgi:hypothetical protein
MGLRSIAACRRPAPPATHGHSALEQYSALGLPVPALETDSAFNEFDADAMIRALLPDLLAGEPEALDILRNAAQNRASSSASSP